MKQNILKDLKAFNWQTIIDFGNSLDDLNDAQWRFIKGYVAERSVEKHANDPSFKYVGEVHKDYVWGKYKIDIELKSQLTASMYTKKGQLRKSFGIKLNNSMGTNKKATIDPTDVADILIVVRNDGAFALDRETVVKHAKSGGDGFEVNVSANDIIEISGMISQKVKYPSNLKDIISKAIEHAIP
jgi:hypothetical protein